MGPQQKKTPRGGVFFFCCGPARTLTHSLRTWVVPPPRRGGVFFFAAAPPGPGWCFFFCCGRARTLTHSLWAGAILARPGWCFFFFFAAAPRERSLTHCGPGWCLPLAGVVFFFLAAAPPGRGGVFFLLWPRPDAHSLTLGWGDFGKAGWCFFFCCGPAGSFLVSLKRPGGAAAKKKTPRGGVFFLLRPRADAHSLTAGLGGAFPSPGWCFFFCCGPARTGWCFFFAVAPPRRSLTHFGLGRFRQGRMVFFFLLWPRRVFFG